MTSRFVGNGPAAALDARQLRYFVAVSEERSYTRAAERLHIVQQSVSATIKQLEAAMGVQLFVRSSRRVEPTPAGVALYDQAIKILGQFEIAWQVAREAGGVATPELHIGHGATIGHEIVFALHRAARDTLADVQLSWRARYNDELLPLISNGSVDIGITSFADQLDLLEYERIASIALGAVVQAGDPLAEKEKLSITDFNGHTLIVVPRRLGPRYYDEYERMFRDAGLDSELAESELPEAGVGPTGIHGPVAGLSSYSAAVDYVRRHPGKVVARPMDDDAPKIPLEMVWNRARLSPEVERFKQVCRDMAATLVDSTEPES